MIRSEHGLVGSTKEELIQECDHLDNMSCDNCGVKGDWVILRMELEREKKIQKQLLLFVDEVNGQVRSNIYGGHQQYAQNELKLALDSILKKMGSLIMFNEHDYVQNLFRIESFALIVVDFSVPEPSTTVSVVEVENMSYRTIAHLTVYLEQQLT